MWLLAEQLGRNWSTNPGKQSGIERLVAVAERIVAGRIVRIVEHIGRIQPWNVEGRFG